MAENVSSSVLFHFTKSVENLKNILKNGFSPRYCPEYTLERGDIKAAAKRISPMHAAPLVCFCDLPLSLIRKHLSEYGNFGIGLNKEWGVKNGVTPVIYTHAKAQTRPPLLRLTAEAEGGGDDGAASDLRLLAAYTKPFVGAAWRNNKVEQKVKFYDEREWRYVPALRKGEPLFLSREDYTNIPRVNRLHRQFKTKYAMPVGPDDVQYLIVPEDKDILALAKYIKRLYSRDDAVFVTTAIMTIDCIHEDV